MKFETIVHQTLRDDENPDYVENNGPFSVDDVKNSYLGRGYYFWDDHFELAQWWGQEHCKDSYIICQADFSIFKDDFYDLVGSRQDQKHFKECAEILEMTERPIGEIIEALKELNERPDQKGVFPYKAIRAVDIKHSWKLSTIGSLNCF